MGVGIAIPVRDVQSQGVYTTCQGALARCNEDFIGAVPETSDGQKWIVGDILVEIADGEVPTEAIVIAGQLSRPHDTISFMEIPKAPSPAIPITGTSGRPTLAPQMAGKP